MERAEIATEVKQLGTVLGVFAHPDDETYLMGGVLAVAAANGQHTACVTATAGEHGTPDPERWPPDRLAALRRRELEEALAVLGVGEHRWLGLEDGRCDQEHEVGTAAVAAAMDEIRPDTVVTFGPDGVTGHADHRAVGRWATTAGAARGLRVLQVAKTLDWVETFSELHDRHEIFDPGFPVATEADRIVVDLELDDETLDRKVSALRAQPSQIDPVIESLGFEAWRGWLRREMFATPRTDG